MTTDATRRIGIIGLGIMGGAIARNLVERGWTVVGCDIDPRRIEEGRRNGIQVVDDPAAVARAAEHILTSLPSPAAFHDVARAVAASGVPKGRIVAEMSTLKLDDKLSGAETLSAAGHVLLDCPLSGTGAQAQNRDLIVYASGDAAAIEAIAPVFADCTRGLHNVGAFGNGTRMKLVANLLVAIYNVASAEALVLGMKAGLDPHQIVKLISAGAANSRIFELRAPLMADRAYEPATMAMGLWQKDMMVIDDLARSLGCPTPLFSATQAFYRAAISRGQASQDTASVCTVLEAMAGLERAHLPPRSQ